MSTTIIMQARMGSSRLPGKILMDIGGQPAIALQLARMARAQVDHVVVATSVGSIDDPVAELAASLGYSVFRGSELDVLGRFVHALDAFPADTVIRTTGDCPFIDPTIIDSVLATFHAKGADYCSNTLLRTFPVGLDCEVLRSDVIRVANDQATLAIEREHVTPFVYRHPEQFQLDQYVGSQFLGNERWTLDTPDDLAQLQHMATLVANPVTATWQDYLEAYGVQRPPEALGLQPDLANAAGNPRRWLVRSENRTIGEVTLRTVAATGTLQIDLESGSTPALRPQVEALVRQALRSDCQVDDLVVS